MRQVYIKEILLSTLIKFFDHFCQKNLRIQELGDLGIPQYHTSDLFGFGYFTIFIYAN